MWGSKTVIYISKNVRNEENIHGEKYCLKFKLFTILKYNWDFRAAILLLKTIFYNKC